jgi:protocatechuate 3,4-dioxygenase beta subunit
MMKPDSAGGDPDSRELSRREMLGIVGVAGIAALVRGETGDGQAGPPTLACVVRPEQTEGPYFVDELLNRADIRIDPTDRAVSDGLPLTLRMSVHRVDGRTCNPLSGAQVDIWQCDALGVYSDVRDTNGLFDTRGKKFLRGYQVTDANGAVEFQTIYPGWYAGRTPHIHFKIRVPAGPRTTYDFTSQLYFDDAISDQVFARPPYSAKGRRSTRNQQDAIFAAGGSGAQLLLALVRNAQGYTGSFDIGLQLT